MFPPKQKLWVTEITDQCMALSSISRDLEDLAEAFSLTGNPQMAERLHTTSKRVEVASKVIVAEVGQYITSQVDASMRAYEDTLNSLTTKPK